MSVLAHVVSRSLAPEPAATQALGYRASASPFRLRTGVERDAVVDDAADQMEVIARKIVDGLNSE